MAKERTAKVVVVGDISVGKTCLLLRFTNNKFPLLPVITIGQDFKQRSVNVANMEIKMQVWDTAGQERYKSLTSRFFRGAHGIILVFDVTNMKSFVGIQNWIHELDYHGISRSSCVLVGNKIDMSNERVIGSSQASTFAERFGLPYIETSVKDDINVHDTFVTLAKQMVEQMNGSESSWGDHSVGTLTLQKNDGKNKRKCRC